MSTAPWWSEAFAAEYVDLYPHRDLAAARAEARFLVEHGLRGRVLDLCCGWGRHLDALDELGLAVAGVDFSADLLARLANLPDARPVATRVVRGDARRPPFRDRAFDGDVALLAGLARVLAPEGIGFLDVMNPAHVRATLVPESRRERAGAVLLERRRIEGACVRKDVELVRYGRVVRTWYELVRMYEPAELDARIAAAGLSVDARWGGFDGAAFGPESPRQLVRVRPGASPGR